MKPKRFIARFWVNEGKGWIKTLELEAKDIYAAYKIAKQIADSADYLEFASVDDAPPRKTFREWLSSLFAPKKGKTKMKFRKKPVTVEAIQWIGTNMDEIGKFMDGVVWSIADHDPVIPTLEGDMKVSLNDWIIRGVQGEFYPCKPDIFAATYDPEAPALEGHADNIAKITRIVNERLRPDNLHVDVVAGTPNTYTIEITNKATGPRWSFWLRMKGGMIRECDGEGGSWDAAHARQSWIMDTACALHRHGINNLYIHIEEL